LKAGQKDKQWSTTHYTEKWRSINMNPTKTGGELRCSGRVAVPAPLVVYVVWILGTQDTGQRQTKKHNTENYQV
jgi:hypothetical protein